eukprot:6695105-Prymnesium_polylepis.1
MSAKGSTGSRLGVQARKHGLEARRACYKHSARLHELEEPILPAVAPILGGDVQELSDQVDVARARQLTARRIGELNVFLLRRLLLRVAAKDEILPQNGAIRPLNRVASDGDDY